jgi:hypothetical protein
MIIQNIHGRLQTLCFVYRVLLPRHGVVVLVELLFLATSIAGFWVAPSVPVELAARAVFWLSVAGLLYSGGKLTYEIAVAPKLDAEVHHVRRDQLRTLQASTEEEADGFTVLRHGAMSDHLILYSSHFNSWLRKNRLPGHRDQSEGAHVWAYLQSHAVQLAAVLRHVQYCSARGYQYFSNEAKIGIASPIHSKVQSVACFRTDYFSSVLTNDIWLQRFCVTRGCSSQEFFSAPELPLSGSADPGQSSRLRNFGSYAYSNHLGASTLAITDDFVLQLWRQSHQAQQSGGLIAPSGSGSCDWRDALGASTLNQIAIKAMNREVWEESLRRGAHRLGIDSMIRATALIGYFRDIRRGGLPGFLGLTRLRANAHDLFPDVREVTRADEMELALHVPTLGDLRRKVGQLIEARTISLPLWANCLALLDLIEEDPDFVQQFIGFRNR